MNQIMQKQRSPYTGGGFNVQQLKSPSFGNTEGLNGMPFLVQLAKQVQRPIQRVGSPPPQPFSKLGGDTAAGHERGLRSGTPRSYDSDNNVIINHTRCNNNNNNSLHLSHNHCYEGEMPTLPLGACHIINSSSSNIPFPSQAQNDEFSHKFQHMEPPLDALHPLEHLGGHPVGDTDSESEYGQHMKDFGGKCTGQIYWRRAFDCLKARMPPQRQERMEMTLRKCRAHSVAGHVLLLLQLLRILLLGAIGQGLRLGINFGQTSYQLWRCKFQLRSIVRQFLWRMANAKGNDVLLFLGIMLVTPWLFLISLVGFIVSTLFHVKLGLGAFWSKLRLTVLR
ncbi:hypothetical protein ACLKA7_017346 [Drosophila subpalustris]